MPNNHLLDVRRYLPVVLRSFLRAGPYPGILFARGSLAEGFNYARKTSSFIIFLKNRSMSITWLIKYNVIMGLNFILALHYFINITAPTKISGGARTPGAPLLAAGLPSGDQQILKYTNHVCKTQVHKCARDVNCKDPHLLKNLLLCVQLFNVCGSLFQPSVRYC